MELRNSLPMSRDLFGTWKNLVLNEQILINRIAKIVTIEANLGNNVTGVEAWFINQLTLFYKLGAIHKLPRWARGICQISTLF